MPLDSDTIRWRILLARLTIACGALLQLGLIAGLPIGQLTSNERISLLTLSALLLLSVGSAIALGWAPVIAIVALGAASLISLLVLGRSARVFFAVPGLIPHWTPGVIWAFALASAACYSAPIALVIAWPLRNTKSRITG